VIADLDDALAALQGSAGTEIVADRVRRAGGGEAGRGSG